MNQCSVVIQVASSEEQVMRLQRELHQSAAETEKHLTAVRKLETERSSLRDELETTKEEVCNKTYLIQVKTHLHQFLAFFFRTGACGSGILVELQVQKCLRRAGGIAVQYSVVRCVASHYSILT